MPFGSADAERAFSNCQLEVLKLTRFRFMQNFCAQKCSIQLYTYYLPLFRYLSLSLFVSCFVWYNFPAALKPYYEILNPTYFDHILGYSRLSLTVPSRCVCWNSYQRTWCAHTQGCIPVHLDFILSAHLERHTSGFSRPSSLLFL